MQRRIFAMGLAAGAAALAIPRVRAQPGSVRPHESRTPSTPAPRGGSMAKPAARQRALARPAGIAAA